MTTCSPGETQDCTCLDGSDGTQTCNVTGTGFAACECDGGTSLDSGTVTGDTDDTDGTGGTIGDEDSTTTGPIPCTTDEECTDITTADCQLGVCGEDGVCEIGFMEFGTACGSATDDACTRPDSCDNAGNCLANNNTEGLTCSTCTDGQCACVEGECGECQNFAPTNNFTTSRSIEGWEFTGGWGLHLRAAQSQLEVFQDFPGQVLGTDGNRAAPYPGAEIEDSYALSRPTVLPDEIIFLSWHVDEGGGMSDNKTIRVTTDDGMSWTTLVDCAMDPGYVFCQPNTGRDPAIWDLAQVPVPAALQGQVGRVEFGYNSGDDCCEFEQGWYIDSLNVATDCMCVVDEDCAAFSDTCGTGFCGASGECGLLPAPEGDPCGDPFDNDCNGADTCNGAGYCVNNEQASGLALCGDCMGGGPCSFCMEGDCQLCTSFTDLGDFANPLAINGWEIVALDGGQPDWGLYDEAPPNELAGSLPVPFPNAPVFGIDGNQSPPYPGTGEAEHSQVTTTPAVVPNQITFISWNVDEGGSTYDTKHIEVSVDDGMTWNTLVNCAGGGGGQPFCNNVGDGRLATDWDNIVIDTSAYEGMTGRLRFTYDTIDSCCSFERGWFIDDLSFASFCNDDPFPPPPPG